MDKNSMAATLTEIKEDPFITEPRYPKCTNDGKVYCDIVIRKKLRGGKSSIPEETIKKLGILKIQIKKKTE
jgi:hypothetical protein